MQTSPAGLSIHLAERSSGPGLQPLSSPAGTVYPHAEPLVTSADTSMTRVLPSPFGDYRVVVQLKDGVPDRLAPYCGSIAATYWPSASMGDSSRRNRSTIPPSAVA